MKIEFNPTKFSRPTISTTMLQDMITENVERQFGKQKTSEETHVVFDDGNMKVFFEGSLEECFCYFELFHKYIGLCPAIYSKEKFPIFAKEKFGIEVNE